MPVFRVEKNSNYTTMCNYHLRDQGLSLKGKGLLSMLLSLPDTWNYSVRGLSSITPDGVDGVLTALKELERLGYLERNQQRESNGRMGRAEYVIYEMPRKKPCSESPCTEKPYAVNPDTDTPVTENPAQLSTNRTSTETINKREKKEIQHRYGSYENVLLSDTEYGKLRQEFPGDYQMRVERLSEYMYFDAKEFGKRLHDVRTSRGITQEELAVRLGLASKQHVSRMENGERSCSIDLLIELSCILHVSTDYLLMGSEPSKEEVKNDLLSIISELSTIAKKI